MTTTNGGHGRIVETIEGTVERANPRGVKLVGEDEYRNFSKYADPPIAPPRRGQHVTLGLDADGFVRDLVVDIASQPAPDTSDRSREIRRQVAMKCAATITAAALQSNAEARAEHVFPLADRILAWLEQPEPEA